MAFRIGTPISSSYVYLVHFASLSIFFLYEKNHRGRHPYLSMKRDHTQSHILK